MSIASPTLRSSSNTAPGPRLSRLPTSIWARPSTAETWTGTSNTASRSAAPRLTDSESEGTSVPASGTTWTSPPFSRSGSGTFVSSSLIAASPEILCGWRVARRNVPADHFVYGRRCRGLITVHAAIGPFDAAVAGCQCLIGRHGKPPFESTRTGNLLDLFFRGVINARTDPYGHMRSRDQVVKAVGGEGGDLDKRLPRQQRRCKLCRDRHSHFHRFGFKPGFDRRERAVQPAKPIGDHGKGGCDALRSFLLRLFLAGGKAVAIGLRLGIRAPALVFDQRDGRLFAGGGILIEQIFCRRCHCVLNRSIRLRRGSSRSEFHLLPRGPWLC